MLWLLVEAPFATFRTFTAGWYRPTATFLTPSAAYGLVLNIASKESRLREGDEDHDGKTPATLTRTGLPRMKLALGAAGQDRRGNLVPFEHAFPRVQSSYQQLHNYPVGASGKERAGDCKGNKYNITPVRREFLTDLRAILGIDTDAETVDLIRRGLAGELPRYGVPFLGDNNFLPDRLTLLETPSAAYWFRPVLGEGGIRQRTARLTKSIDRADLSRTTSQLFAPDEIASDAPPDDAWVAIPEP